MKRNQRLFLVFVLGALVIRCGGTTGPQSGSESHFLDVCSDANPCGSGFTCMCGVCTRPCTDASACADLASGTVCVATCGGGERHCAVGCRSSADCASRGPNFVCASGECREKGPVGNLPDGGADVSTPRRHDAAVPSRDAAVSVPDARTHLPDAVVLDVSTSRCDGSACFCDNLPSCTPAEDFTALPLGSSGRRICGARIRSGNPGGLVCEFTAFNEVEGGVTGMRCVVPLGSACNSPTPCEQIFSCNVLMQSCPTDLLDCSRPELAPDAGVDSGGTGTADASACAALETDLVTEWSKVGECAGTSDCTTAYNNLCASSGPVIGDVGCFLPVARSSDLNRLTQLEQRYVRECHGQPGTCDCTAPPASKCVAGHCRITAP